MSNPASGLRTRRCKRLAFAAALVALAAGASVGGAHVAWTRYVDALGPLDLKTLHEGSTIAVDRNDLLLRAFTTEHGRWRLPLATNDTDPRFLAMLKAYEDRRFDSHAGVDWSAMLRAAGQMLTRGRVISGGSTLTMQVARLLEPREDRTLAAKLRQIARARQLEQRFSKTEILDLYLLLAPYGGNLEGLRAASLAYFGKEPARLSLGEQALLVALPQSPEARRPDRSQAAARQARERVIARLQARGFLTAAEAERANREPVPSARKQFPTYAAHASEAAHAREPTRRIIRFTLDRKAQASVEALLRDHVRLLGPKVTGALIAIDNRSGEVIAQAGSADYFDAERAGAIDMTRALRSPGSALKPFIYAIAFDSGIAHPETMLEDRRMRYGAYAPENFDLTYQGQVSARFALQHSLNVPAVALLNEVGASRFLARMKNAGAEIVLPKDAAPGLAIALGGAGITLVDLVRMYGALGRQGRVPPFKSRRDKPAEFAGGGLIGEAVSSWYVADVLLGAPPPLNAPAGHLAYKTGTSYGYRDAFAIGFDANTTIGVWFGRADNGPVPGLVARQAAAPALFDAFARIGAARQPVTRPPNALVARTHELPPPLRHLRKDAPKTVHAAQTGELKIAYPPQGARIDLGLKSGVGAMQLALKVQGGVAPYRWLVNGAPAGEAQLRREAQWKPDGAGFARVSIIDAKGATDSVLVRLE